MLHWKIWSLVPFLLPGYGATAGNGCTYPLLGEATSDQLEAGLRDGCFSSVDLVNAYVARINEVNSTLHVVLEINPDALDIARELDAERKNGKIRGPLHGLPVMIKAMIGTDDQMNTTVGSYALLGAKSPADSTVAAKLREKGLVILGKTSMSEWANVRSLNSTNGWNALGGQTYGAYYPLQDPCGSSSGSAVSTDLGLALATLGTETSGSIVCPSNANNIVGIKPTVGLTSRYLVIPVSERQDTIGPLARTVKDAANMLQAMVGEDPNDNYTLASPFTRTGYPDYVAACKLSGLKGKRIGIPSNVIGESDLTDPVVSAFKNAISVMAAAGAVIVENANFTEYDAFLNDTQDSNIVIAGDLTSNLADYLSLLTTNPNNIHSLEDVRYYTQHNPLEDYPQRDTGLFDEVIAAQVNKTSPQFWEAYQQNLQYAGEGGILGAISRNRLDAIILPSAISSSVPAIVGSPIISVPLGASPNGTAVEYDMTGTVVEDAPGFPFGISFLGDKWSEEGLIEIAYAFEQRTMNRQKLTGSRYIEAKTELEDFV